MAHHVFVYGTLRQGKSNHGLLNQSELLGVITTEPLFDLFDLGPYPAAIEGSRTLVGEVYRVDDLTMAQLDELEDYPVEYDRKQIDTPFGLAWIYLYQNHQNLTQLIESGDYCQAGHQ
ncbi:gamma-glutamylcyclotransferase family protein [Vibrio gangliei]|uniref:gamma-glutamylcyclotransferase family protein n=1 Tax=Vibrio gangliei TaxID=2077090 RepID=UPI000D01AFA6|nr:gamma-glutamylcyclotransferase family protein [Vibrio gangliei]